VHLAVAMRRSRHAEDALAVENERGRERERDVERGREREEKNLEILALCSSFSLSFPHMFDHTLTFMVPFVKRE